ncbi:hypothetical protein DM860_002734 [Cuscuta australis]|uniref:Uncharacterized protein n=1 Tax=Cuscuta australis TaxID=267555 RepID=A0A328D466_9ASTE|nr:hypothetical protein DM860_002734 [Cuscuta australis]
MHPKALARVLERVRDTLGCSLDVLSFTYLGCPIYHGRKCIHYFEPILKKMRDKCCAWMGCYLSRGKAIMIKSVLQAIPTHLLAAHFPPKIVDGCSGYWTDGVGDMYRFDFMIDHDALPPTLLRQLRLEPPSLVSDHADISVWTPSTDGKLTLASAKELLRPRRDDDVEDTVLKRTGDHCTYFLSWEHGAPCLDLFHRVCPYSEHTSQFEDRLEYMVGAAAEEQDALVPVPPPADDHSLGALDALRCVQVWGCSPKLRMHYLSGGYGGVGVHLSSLA